MRILIITHNNNENSGANKSLMSLIDEWKNSNIYMEVVVNKTKGNLPSLIQEKGLKYLQIDYNWICSPRRHNWLRDNIVYFRSKINYTKGLFFVDHFFENCKLKKYDLIYTNTSVVDLGALLSLKLNIPHIWHFREFGEEDFHFKYVISQKQRIKLYNSAKKIIVISKALKEKYKTYIPEEKIELISNGVEINKHLYTNNNVLHNPIQLLIAGQISKSKGQDQAIKAVNLLGDKYPIVLNIAGKGEQKFLKEALKNVSNKKCIKVLGQVSNLYELRKKIDIELVCSKSEAFGRVTLEAMLHQIPVIGARAGGTAELLCDNETGLLYELYNYKELSDKIEKLILDDSLRKNIAFNGQFFAQKFDIKITAEKILKLFYENI